MDVARHGLPRPDAVRAGHPDPPSSSSAGRCGAARSAPWWSASPDLPWATWSGTLQRLGRDHAVGYAGQFFGRNPRAAAGERVLPVQRAHAWRELAQIARVRARGTWCSPLGPPPASAVSPPTSPRPRRGTGHRQHRLPAEDRLPAREAGYDAAFDYHDGPVVDRLRELAPDGITVFFDNVGGDKFEAAVQAVAPGARRAVRLAGAVAAAARASSAPNSAEPHPARAELQGLPPIPYTHRNRS
ncbi:hypothetical protein LT493_12000 [Streptomyces tricolor]|nr:hypothetical protein [Streptomyces tricolor]